MSLVARRLKAEPFETWPSMKAAAEERFWDGFVLATGLAGRESGAIYLWGYVAEMLLKTAYFEYSGKAMTDRVYTALKNDVLAAATPPWQGKGNPDLHNLTGLSAFLIDTRTVAGDMDVGVAAALQFHITTIEAHWEVSMRYSAFSATIDELEAVYNSIAWIRANYDQLWS